MIARGDLVAEILRRRAHQPLRCKQLSRGNHFVGSPGKKIHRKQQAREVDRLPQGDEASAGEFVALVQFLDNSEIVGSGNIDCPRIPVLEDGFEPREFWRADRLKRLQGFANTVCVRVVSPELREIAAENATIAEIDQALKHSQGGRLGDGRQSGLPRSNINRRTGHNKLAYLGRESSGIDQGQPASLAKPDEINQAADTIDKDIEIGKIFVNSEKSHVSAGRAPIGHEQSFSSSTEEGGNETVSDCKVGNSGSMQRERCAQQGRNAALDHRKVTEPDCMQFERNLAWRGSFRLLRIAVATSIA